MTGSSCVCYDTRGDDYLPPKGQPHAKPCPAPWQRQIQWYTPTEGWGAKNAHWATSPEGSFWSCSKLITEAVSLSGDTVELTSHNGQLKGCTQTAIGLYYEPYSFKICWDALLVNFSGNWMTLSSHTEMQQNKPSHLEAFYHSLKFWGSISSALVSTIGNVFPASFENKCSLPLYLTYLNV